MKRELLGLLLILSSSCGQYSVDAGLGGVKSTNPVTVEGDDLRKIQSICDALAKKNAASLVNTVAVFDYSKRNCAEKNLSKPASVTTTIAGQFDNYKFIQSNGVSPYFSDIETLNKGLMANICASLNQEGGVKSPIKENGSYLYFTTRGINADQCSAGGDEVCILLERGNEFSEGQVGLHTRDWVRFNLDERQGRVGFFTMRRQVTSGPCAVDETQETVAFLK